MLLIDKNLLSKKPLCVKIFWINLEIIFMQLHERIRMLAERKNISLAKIAEIVGVYPQKFNQWLNEKSQKNLWEHLPKILDAMPDVRGEWLYMGQEPAFKNGGTAEDLPTRNEMQALKDENERLKAELAEADRINRKLTARMLIDGVGDKDASHNTAKAAGQD